MKRTLAFLLSLMMVFSLLPASVLATETPVSEVPDNVYTRMEAARLIADVLGLEYQEEMAEWAYSDLSVDTEDGKVAAMMAYHSIMQNGAGNFYGDFGPDEPIQRYEMAMSLNRALPLEAGSVTIPDAIPVEHPFGWAAVNVVSAGLMDVDETGKFRPHELTLSGDIDLVRMEELLNPPAEDGTGEPTTGGSAGAEPLAPQATDMAWDQGISLDGIYHAPARFSFHGTNGVAYELNLYRRGETEDVLVLNKTVTPKVGFWNILPFHYEPSRCQTGVYYFTVQALGDNSTYADAPVQVSEDWSYTCPDAVVTVTDLYWGDDLSMNWEESADVLECELIILYNREEDDLANAEIIDQWNGMHAGCSLSAELLAAYETGWYYFGVLPATADPSVALSPEDFVYSDAYYHNTTGGSTTGGSTVSSIASGICGADLQWSLSADYVLTITGSGEMYDYEDAPWSAWSEQITAVSLPEGLTYLGESALYKCKKITEIDLPDSLETIGSRALAACHSLESVHIPANVREIQWNALGFNTALTEITVDPANTTFRVEGGCLLTMDGKTLVAIPGGLTGTVTLPDGLAAIGAYACCGSAAEAIVLPDSLLAIQRGAFSTCSLLESIEIPAGVTQVDKEAFNRCESLQSVTFLGNAPTLDENVFGGCASDFCIYYDPTTTGWSTPEWNGWPACPIGSTPVLPEAPAATKLQWNVGITSSGEKTASGWFSFYGTNGVDYAVNLYRQDAAGDNLILSKTATPVKGYYNVMPFNYEPTRCQTGTYYFTVQAMGDGNAYADGPIQTSAVWHYTRPNAELVPTDLYWSVDKSMNWNLDETYVLEYHVGVLYNGTEDNLNGARMVDEDWYGTTETPVLSEELLAKYGTGWYYFAVQPITYDPTVTLTPADIFYSNGYYYYNASTTLPEAPAAYDLQWGVERWNENDYNTVPGAISFTCDVPDDVETVDFQVDIYRRDGQDSVHIGTTHLTVWPDEYSSFQPFEHFADKFTSGTYYFTVTSMGDGSTTCDGKPVTSDDWTYTRPNTQYGVSDPEWNSDMSMQWTAGSTGQADYYVLQFQHVGPGDTFHADNWNSSTNYWPGEGMAYPTSWILKQGNGQVYFRVLAMSEDVTRVAPSQWSDWSVAFDYTKPSLTLTASNLRWDATTGEMLWDLNGSSDLVDYYQVRFYHSKSNSRPSAHEGSTRFDPEDGSFTLPEWVLRDCGKGYYWFAVRTYSNNPTKALSGEYVIGNSAYYFEGPSATAPAAYDLQWNTWRNSSGSDSDYQLGVISFGRTDTDMEQEFRVDFYRKEASGDKKIGELWAYLREGRPYRTMYPFEELGDVFTTGTYYFTVTAMGDGSTTCDGQPVRSGEWSYTRPEVKLSVSNAHWGTDMSINWTDAAQNDAYLDYYEVQYQYVGSGDTFRDDNWDYGTSYRPGNSSDFPYPPADLMGDRGNGKYYFRVRAISNSINEAVYSDWSDWSGAFTYTRPATTLTVSDLKWEGNTLSWTPDFGKDAPLAGYQIYIYEKSSYAVSNPDAWWDWDSAPADATSYTMPKWMLEDLPDRTWYFAVTTISANPAAYNSNYGSAATAEWTYQASTTPAPAATDLQWNLYRNSQGSYSYEEPGTVSFGRQTTGTQEEFRVDFYRKETNSDVIICTLWANLSGSRKYARVYPFEEFADNFTTGTYYFTVTTMGDGVTTVDSQPVRSEDWTYTRPDIKLGVSNPLWKDNMSVSWTDASQNAAHTEYYSLRYQYVAQGDTLNPNNWNYGTSYWPDSNDSLFVPADLLMDRGSGKYYFQVRAMSADVTRAVHSDWTQWSAAFDYTRPANTLTVSDLKWEGNTLSWTADFDTDLLESYRIYVYEKAAYATANPDGWWDFAFEPADDTSFTVPQWMIDNLPRRTWHLAVTTLSADPATANSNYGSAPTAEWTYQAPETPAEPAFDLQWGVRRWQIGQSYEEPGVISFGGTVPQGADRAEFQIDIYRREADGNVKIGTFYRDLWSGDDFSYYQPFDEFADQFTTGTYFFTVTALGDGVNTCDSQPVTSPDWSYVRPDVTLGVSNPVWNSNMSIGWTDAPQNVGLLSNFDLEFRYVAPGQTFDPNRGGTYGTSYKPGSGDDPYPNSDMLLENGSGTYYFRMRAMPEDVTCAVPSGWTEWSTGFAYTRPSTTLTVSNLKWEGNTLSWMPDFDPATAPLLKYWIYVYENAGDAISNPWNNQNRYLLEDASATSFTLQNRWLDELEGRDWHFAVVTVTSNPTKANSNWGSAPTCKWTYTAPANKLGTPSELQWNVDYDNYWENGAPVQQTPFQRMGVISFRRAEVDQNQYEAKVYRVGEDQPVQEMRWGYGSEDVSKYFAMSSFIYENHPSGEYYFTLRAYSDDINYGHGDWVDSRDYPNGVFHYVKPDASNKLGTATGLRWDDRTFTNHNGSDLIAARWFPVTGAGYYEVRTLFSPTKDGTPREIGTSFDIRPDDFNLHSILNEWEIADRGNGWYYFQVRVISDDITRINNGDWSALSNPYPLGYVSEYVEDTVSSATDLVDNALTNSSATAQDKQAAAQVAVDAVAQLPQLNAVLSADTTNSETVKELKELEEKVAEVLNVKIKQPIINDPDLQQKMDVDAIQISNMALNVDTGSTEQRSVQLKIDAVDETTAPPALNETLYKNTVEFSMKIEGAVDADENIPGHQLNVPVKMVLPVPAGINPDFLVVLHHKESDGSWEEIHPHVYQESGKWFATFVVDSFSNFSLAELTMTARNTGHGSVEISYNNLPDAPGTSGRYLLAVYSKDGQMLGMTMLSTGGQGTVTIQTGSEKDPATVKLMTADAGNGWKPVDEIRPIEIRK